MYQAEVKALVVAKRFDPADGWIVTVDLDAMELARGGQHPADKAKRTQAALRQLERLGVTIGKHPTFGRADIVAHHSEWGTVVVEVEGSSSRQREQAMYSAIGQLLLSMRHDTANTTYALAVPDDGVWPQQLEKLPLIVLGRLKLRLLLVGSEDVENYPRMDEITDRILLLDEPTVAVVEEGLDDDLDAMLRGLHRTAKRGRGGSTKRDV
ncbi:MAG: hypothetical protein KA154_08620 [Gemmatimonadaceae bacterium]|jgi:hypothetical protein|nr:hypothetical protein [Gemmatimonadaceae bacterium]